MSEDTASGIKVRLALLDVNETLIDMAPLAQRFVDAGVAAEAAEPVRKAWFAAVLRDGFAVTSLGGYAEFADIARGLAEQVLQQQGVADPTDAAGHVLAGLSDLVVHPDVPDGLRRLSEAGVRLVPLTNGGLDVSTATFERAGVLDLFETRLSVSTPRVWKPAAAAYDWALDELGADRGTTTLLAVHPWDIGGARAAGLGGAWVRRGATTWPSWFEAPDVQGEHLGEVVDTLLA